MPIVSGGSEQIRGPASIPQGWVAGTEKAVAMTVGVARITLRLHANQSLKEKRRILKSLIDKSRHRFNVSVAEVADQDLYQRATVGVAVVGNDNRVLNSLLDRIISYMDSLQLADLIDQEIELIPLGE
jgi:uncharacterized protein